jgi:hypothetical protein
MKRLSNMIFYLVLAPVIIHSFYTYFSGEDWFFTPRFFLTSFFILLGAYVMNVVARYSGLLMFLGKKKSEYVFVARLGQTAMVWRAITFGISIPFALGFGLFFLMATPYSVPAGLLLLFSAFEKLIYLLISSWQKAYCVGITSQMLVIHNGDFKVLSLSGIGAIERKYDELLFVYSASEVKSIPVDLVNAEELTSFHEYLVKLGETRGFPVSLIAERNVI